MASKCIALPALLAAGLGLAACQSVQLPNPADLWPKRDSGEDLGKDVIFVQDVMRQSAKMPQAPKRAEQAVKAVEDWRGGEDGG